MQQFSQERNCNFALIMLDDKHFMDCQSYEPCLFALSTVWKRHISQGFAFFKQQKLTFWFLGNPNWIKWVIKPWSHWTCWNNMNTCFLLVLWSQFECCAVFHEALVSNSYSTHMVSIIYFFTTWKQKWSFVN